MRSVPMTEPISATVEPGQNRPPPPVACSSSRRTPIRRTPGYSTQGGGALSLSGTEYFHNNSSTSTMHFGGNPSGVTYMVGLIVTDDLQMNGNPSLAMVLSQKKLFISLKVGLFE
jgi:hypothetical protein